jgi:thymidylate synthase (FAD)
MHSIDSELRFKVSVCPYATSPAIGKAIWTGQHTCVSDDLTIDDDCPLESTAAEQAVIKHQLNGDRGHYSVLNMAFIKFNISGFPHSTMCQVTRHHESHFLVTSGRYTGQRFIDVINGKKDIEDVFFVRPPGKYGDREGKAVEWDKLARLDRLDYIVQACEHYKSNIERGMPFEMAREFLPYCFRQNFTMSGTLKQFWHVLDQRSKKDAEWEIQILAKMMDELLFKLCPELQSWYSHNRFGKARLAP